MNTWIYIIYLYEYSYVYINLSQVKRRRHFLLTFKYLFVLNFIFIYLRSLMLEVRTQWISDNRKVLFIICVISYICSFIVITKPITYSLKIKKAWEYLSESCPGWLPWLVWSSQLVPDSGGGQTSRPYWLHQNITHQWCNSRRDTHRQKT